MGPAPPEQPRRVTLALRPKAGPAAGAGRLRRRVRAGATRRGAIRCALLLALTRSGPRGRGGRHEARRDRRTVLRVPGAGGGSLGRPGVGQHREGPPASTPGSLRARATGKDRGVRVSRRRVVGSCRLCGKLVPVRRAARVSDPWAEQMFGAGSQQGEPTTTRRTSG